MAIAMGASCADRPQEEKKASEHGVEATDPLDEREEPRPTSPEQGGARPKVEGEHDLLEGGPLHGDWEYLLCFWDKTDPLNTLVVLCEKDKKEPGLVHFFVSQREVRHEDPELEFFVHAADPQKLVYWKENPRRMYQLRRVRDGSEVKVPALLLAEFVGAAMDLPILYDARTAFAEEKVVLRRDEDNLDLSRVRESLASGGFPLEEGSLENGRRVLYWRWTSNSQPRPEESRLPPPVVPPITKVPPNPFLPSNLELVGETVDVSSGNVPLMDLLRFLSNFTGLSVYYSSVELGSLESRVIPVVAQMKDVDDTLLKALLEVNGIFVSEIALPGDPKALVASEAAKRE